MDSFNAVGIVEGFIPCDSEEEYIKAWQYLIDNELLCGLQGSFGRTAQALIEQGVCHERRKEGDKTMKKQDKKIGGR